MAPTIQKSVSLTKRETDIPVTEKYGTIEESVEIPTGRLPEVNTGHTGPSRLDTARIHGTAVVVVQEGVGQPVQFRLEDGL
jgi:hypothetical protein